jgi:hypothetical protein
MTPSYSRAHWQTGVWSWCCPVYRTSFVLVRCARADIRTWLGREIPYADFVESLARRFNPEQTFYRGQFVGGHHNEHGDVAVVWLHPDSDVDTLAHELLHVLTSVLADRGLLLSNDSDEAFAYYLAWLMRESLQRLEGTTA